jgi:hypothetical protein
MLQVADRFHLVKNLGAALERFFNRHRRLLQQVPRPIPEPAVASDEAPLPLVAPAPVRRAAELAWEQKRAQCQTRYEMIRGRPLLGASIAQIARDLQLNWKTVRKYAEADVCPEPRPSPVRPRLLSPYEDYLRRRWAEGCRNGPGSIRKWRLGASAARASWSRTSLRSCGGVRMLGSPILRPPWWCRKSTCGRAERPCWLYAALTIAVQPSSRPSPTSFALSQRSLVPRS